MVIPCVKNAAQLEIGWLKKSQALVYKLTGKIPESTDSNKLKITGTVGGGRFVVF